jgi:hypothetical protein
MKKSLGFKNSSHMRQGIALVTVLIMLVMMVTLVSVTSLLALNNRRTTADTITSSQAQYAAEAGVEMALKRVYWDPYDNWSKSADALVTNQTTKATVEFDNCAYKKWLTGIGKDATTAKLKDNNASDCPYVNFSTPATDFPFADLTNSQSVNFSSSNSGLTNADTKANALDAGFYNVTIDRKDSSDLTSGDINLSIRSIGTVKDSAGTVIGQRVVSRSLKIAGDPYEGDRFAMLTTAANCSFCHLQIDTRERALSTTGTFDRARIGFTSTTNTLDFAEKPKADVVIYGGIYTRGNLSNITVHNDPDPTKAYPAGGWARYGQQKDGKVKAGKNSDMVAASTDTSLNNSGDYAFDGNTASTFYKNNVWDASKLYNSTTSLQGGANRANGVFYHNYPTKKQVDSPTGIYKGAWPDGALPDEFPSAIPDGGDGHVSDDDWAAFVTSAPIGNVVNDASANAAIFYGVKRPSSTSKTGSNIPWTYNPIVANAITDTGTIYNTANLQTAANFKKWWITQALASPNNRDFLPTTPAGGTLPFNPTASSNAYQNNFYVNYNPTLKQLTLAYCSGLPYSTTPSNTAVTTPTDRINLEKCARGQYDNLSKFVSAASPSAANGNSLRSVTLSGIDDTIWFPQASNDAQTALTTGSTPDRKGYFDGNLIIDAGKLVGGKLPMKLNGTILVNGDLVIRGKVRGNGRIVARGNIYVVGDLVYACDDNGALCTENQYAIGTDLPKLALLAGGNIIVGDYDAPDSRVNKTNRAFDLTNDQTGRNQVPDGSITAAKQVTWDYWNVPGSTGRSARANSTDANAVADQYSTLDATNRLSATNPNTKTSFDGHAGFLTRSLEEPNNRTTNKQVFKVSPFGYIIGPASSSELYENGANRFVNDLAVTASVVDASGVTTTVTINKNVSPLYPTNGPLKLGDSSASKGLVTAAGYTNALGCGTSTQMPVRRYTFSGTASGLVNPPGSGTGKEVPTAPFNFSFWCPPSSLTGTSYIRKNGTTNGTSPNVQTDAWMPVNSRDAALDKNMGLTTGWLGGVLTDEAGNPVRGDLSQTRLLKLMWLSTMEAGRAQGPLRTDGIFYSANSIANILKSGKDDRTAAVRTGTTDSASQSSTQSRWIHIGSVIASELGFLTTASSGGDTSGKDFTVNRNTVMDFKPASNSPISTEGSWGSGFSILYDNRLQGFLQVTSTNRVKIKRTGIYTQVGVTR